MSMPKPFRRLSLASSLALLAACASGPDAPRGPEEVMRLQIPLASSLVADATYVVGKPVDLRFALVNRTDHGVYVLTWNTPLEGLRNQFFTVKRDGVELPYRGIMVKRAAPTTADYVAIAAGGEATARVDLAKVYDLAVPGHYTVAFEGRIHDCAPADAELPSRHRTVVVAPSAPVAFDIVAG